MQLRDWNNSFKTHVLGWIYFACFRVVCVCCSPSGRISVWHTSWQVNHFLWPRGRGDFGASPQVFVSCGRFAATARCRDMTGNTSGLIWSNNHVDRKVMKGPVFLTPRLSHSVQVLKWIAEWLTVIIWPCLSGRVSLWGGTATGYLLKLYMCLICQMVFVLDSVFRGFSFQDSEALRRDFL